MKNSLPYSLGIVALVLSLTLTSCSGTKSIAKKAMNHEKDGERIDFTFNGLVEKGMLFEPIPSNQGLTTDGEYLYISPNHSVIEKRRLKDFELVGKAEHPDKIGGLFYDAVRKEILTCSGEYKWGGKAFISRINKDNLEVIEHLDISRHTKQGVNAIVRLNDKIYVGETAVGSNQKSKSWYVFDTDFNFIDTVYSHVTSEGRYDWQDATVLEGIIYATDHKGFVHAFVPGKDSQFKDLGHFDSSGKYYEGITSLNNEFIIWKGREGIVTVTSKSTK